MFAQSVKDTIEKNHMLDKDDNILVGLSGGYDSVCLCLVLLELGYKISVAHINHKIREEAKNDEQFVINFAKKHNLKYHIKEFNIPEISKEMGISLESAGRNARYEYFNELCEQEGYTKIAVAHNKNDNCETLLYNLIRGCGLKGLLGIPKIRDKIVRPLINMERKQIEEYVDNLNIKPVNDATNQSLDYTRNKIRHIILPEMQKLNPNLLSTLERTTEILEIDNDFLENLSKGYVEIVNNKAYINADLLMIDKALLIRLLFEAYECIAKTNKDFEKKHIDYILDSIDKKTHGKIMDLCFGVTCYLEYGRLVFAKKSDIKDYEYKLKINGKTFINEANIILTTQVINNQNINFDEKAAYFDFDKIHDDIIVRNRKSGDRFIPYGMEKSKKIKDLLIDKKVPAAIRDTVPLLVTDRIIWVYEINRSNDYIINNNTKNILKIMGEKHE